MTEPGGGWGREERNILGCLEVVLVLVLVLILVFISIIVIVSLLSSIIMILQRRCPHL